MGYPIPWQGQPVGTQDVPHYYQMPSGSVYLLPAGQLVVECGRQTGIQWYNVFNNTWNNLYGGLANNPTNISSDGTNFRVINYSGTIQGGNITNAGSNYVQGTTSIAFGAPASGITATGVPIIGGDLTLAVTAGGTGYVAPILQIDPPWIAGQNSAGGLPAYAYVSTLTSGVISAVTLNFAGAGYTAAPTVRVIDPAGSGAVITATVGTTNAAKLTGVLMTNPGSGYDGTHIPTVTVTGAGSSGAITAIPSMALQSVTVGSGGAGYSTGKPFVMTDGGMLVNDINGEPTTFRSGFLSTTLTTGAISAVAIEDEGFGFQTVPLVAALNTTTLATTAPSLTAVVGGVNSYVRVWHIV